MDRQHRSLVFCKSEEKERLTNKNTSTCLSNSEVCLCLASWWLFVTPLFFYSLVSFFLHRKGTTHAHAWCHSLDWIKQTLCSLKNVDSLHGVAADHARLSTRDGESRHTSHRHSLNFNWGSFILAHSFISTLHVFPYLFRNRARCSLLCRRSAWEVNEGRQVVQ